MHIKSIEFLPCYGAVESIDFIIVIIFCDALVSKDPEGKKPISKNKNECYEWLGV